MSGTAVRTILAVILCLALDTAAVSSQVSGTVRARDVGPMSAAEVLIWGRGRLVDRLITDGDGRFQSSVPRDSVRRISIHHIGFLTEIIADPTALSSEISVVLDRLPIALPEIEVVVSRDICSEEPSQRAYDLWSAASSRYASDTALRGGLAAGHQESGDVRSDRLGEVRAAQLIPRMSRWRGAGPGQTMEDRVESEGYAWPLEPGASLGARHLHWVYPSFEERHAYHFATATFGERHRFYLMDASDEGAVLAFCPLEGERTGLRGRIELSGDSMFTAARWSVLTGDPYEGAGGEVVFGEVRDANGQRHLVASRGTYWRHSGRNVPYPNLPRSYWQLIRINTEWILSPDSEWPDCRPRWCSSR
jgi:hypothetical protein